MVEDSREKIVTESIVLLFVIVSQVVILRHGAKS